MINRKIAKLFFPAVAGTVIGFSTILATAGMGLAVSTVINSPNNRAISNVVLYLQDTSGNVIKVKVDNFSDAPQETKTYDPTSVLQQYSSYELLAYTVKAGNNTSTMGPGEGQLVIVDSTVQQSQLPVGSATTTYQYTAVLSGSISSVNTNTSSNTTTSTEGTVDTSSNTTSTESTVNTSSNTTSSTASTVDTNQTEPEANTVETNSGDSTEVASNSVPTTQTEDVGNTVNEPVITNTFKQDNGTKPVSVPEPTTVGAIALFGLGGLLTKKKLTSPSK
jgi:hypothetical protein